MTATTRKFHTARGTFSRRTAVRYTHIVVAQGIRLEVLERELAAAGDGSAALWYRGQIRRSRDLAESGAFAPVTWHKSQYAADKAVQQYDRLVSPEVVAIEEPEPHMTATTNNALQKEGEAKNLPTMVKVYAADGSVLSVTTRMVEGSLRVQVWHGPKRLLLDGDFTLSPAR